MDLRLAYLEALECHGMSNSKPYNLIYYIDFNSFKIKDAKGPFFFCFLTFCRVPRVLLASKTGIIRAAEPGRSNQRERLHASY